LNRLSLWRLSPEFLWSALVAAAFSSILPAPRIGSLMALTRDRCLCLRKVEYSETSQILPLLGRAHGLMRLIAKGAHRRTKAGASKFDGGLDLLDLGDAVFSLRLEKDLATLTEWSLRDGHLELRGDLRALYLGQYAGELCSL